MLNIANLFEPDSNTFFRDRFNKYKTLQEESNQLLLMYLESLKEVEEGEEYQQSQVVDLEYLDTNG